MKTIISSYTANKKSLFKLGIAVAALHIIGWALLYFSLQNTAVEATAITLGTGLVAYLLGLRHAFDADHITAAIQQ